MRRTHRLAIAWSLVVIGVLGLAGIGTFSVTSLTHASADTVVTNCANDGSSATVGDLQHAVAYANTHAGSTITFNCPSGTDLKVLGTLSITGAMTIDGGSKVTLDGQNAVQILSVALPAKTDTFTLENITIKDGASSTSAGGLVDTKGTVDLTNTTFTGNTSTWASPDGGAVFLNGGNASANISSCTFTDNTATGTSYSYGGAIGNSGGTLSITKSTFSGNQAKSSGGAPLFVSGGAVFSSAGSVSITDSQFTDNAATNTTNNAFGGAITMEFAPTKLSITGSTFTGNTATGNVGQGGAIYDDQMELDITSSTFTSNTATYSTSSPQYADGGAIFEQGSNMNVLNSTFAKNTASSSPSSLFGSQGGAIDTEVSGTVAVTGSTFSGNSATGGNIAVGGGSSGGAIFDNVEMTVTNSTFTGNTADVSGGAIKNDNTLDLEDDTIAGNTETGVGPAIGGGGGVYNQSDLTVFGTIIANNTAPSGPNCGSDPAAATFTDNGYNLESGKDCGFTNKAQGDQQNANPKLGSLTKNGGPTETLALLAGSPAINAIPTANCNVTTDQRGVKRPQGSGCDIGAFEYEATSSAGRSGNGGASGTPTTAQAPGGSGSTANNPPSSGSQSTGQTPKVVAGAVTQPGAGFPVALLALLAVLCFGLIGGGAVLLVRTRKTAR